MAPGPENVPFALVATLGDIEVRRYPEQIWAETVIQGGGWSDALSEGFERLASYLFGGNNEASRLSMTAPVLSSYAETDRGGSPDHGADQRALQPAPGDTSSPQRTVSFVMPADRDLDSLPAPQDTRVRLRLLPERLVAALRFRGDYRSHLPGEKREELLRRLREAGLRTLGRAAFRRL